jgi:hypothetical protein
MHNLFRKGKWNNWHGRCRGKIILISMLKNKNIRVWPRLKWFIIDFSSGFLWIR